MTKIEWTERTWNPTTGCDRVSAGCDNCYALKMAKRLRAMGQPKYQNDGDPRTSGPGFGITQHKDTLRQPLRWRSGSVFVNSMSDLLHPKVTDDFIAEAFGVMSCTPNLTYQLLTKRHARMRALLNNTEFHAKVAREAARIAMFEIPGPTRDEFVWPLPNLWIGVSVENQEEAERRIPYLEDSPATVRFLSCEPLLSPVDLTPWMPSGRAQWKCSECQRIYSGEWRKICSGCGREGYWSGSYLGDSNPNGQPLSWVIVGGESGPAARPMHPDWARLLRDQCAAAGVPFFFKQWGEHLPVSVVDDPSMFGGRAFDEPGGGGRTAPVIRERGRSGTHRNGEFRPMRPGDRTRVGVMLDRDTFAVRMKKGAAGRQLDGRTWDEYPPMPRGCVS